MQFLLHFTCSCISHAYVLHFNIFDICEQFRAFLIVSLSLLFTLVVSMAPKCKSTPSWNSLHSGASTSSDPTPLSVWFRDEDAHKAFVENFSRRGIHSECQVILADFANIDLLDVIHTRDGSHCVTSWSPVHSCSFKSSTPTCTVLIALYLSFSLVFKVGVFLSHCSLLRMCLGFLG